MPDDLTRHVHALERVPVAIGWDEVLRRAADDERDEMHLAAGPARQVNRPRRIALAAAAVLAVVTIAFALDHDQGGDPVRTGPGSTDTTTSTETTQPTTTLPAIGTTRGAAVEAWTGTTYLVWSGQAGGEASIRADGWMFDPETGVDTTIPPAPIGPRDSAGGVWTGTELIVCCGRSTGRGRGYETSTAAAFDPDSGAWRRLADPPPAADGVVLGSVWTGDQMLVAVVDEEEASRIDVFSYDPATDTWDRRSSPPAADRVGTTVWTGDSLILWLTGSGPDRGFLYDLATDSWTSLPPLPAAHPTWYASAVWAGDQLVVWGNDKEVETAAVGYRWRPGEDAWRPMRPAPIAAVDWFEGTPGSQTAGLDERTGQVVIVSLDPGGSATPVRRDLLAYDPVTDQWSRLGDAPGLGYDRIMRIEDGNVLVPDVEQPIAFTVPR